MYFFYINMIIIILGEFKMNDDKKITSIYIKKEILAHAQENKIVLSNWVNRTYEEQYLGLNSKYKELEELKQREKQLIEEIEFIKQKNDDIKLQLTTEEKRFISTVLPRINRGFSLIAIRNQFNNDYNRAFSLDEFKSIVDFYETQNQKRVNFAINIKKQLKNSSGGQTIVKKPFTKNIAEMRNMRR